MEELSCPVCGHRVIMTKFRAHKGKKNIYVCIECGMTFWYWQERDRLLRAGITTAVEGDNGKG